MKKYKIVNKSRFYTSMVLISLFLISIIFLTFNYTLAKGSQQEVTCISYTVKNSQTIWDIAKEMEYKGDIREKIQEIIEINSLENSIIYPGQTLIIPK